MIYWIERRFKTNKFYFDSEWEIFYDLKKAKDRYNELRCVYPKSRIFLYKETKEGIKIPIFYGGE